MHETVNKITIFSLYNIFFTTGVTGKHIPPRDIVPMGIDSLQNRNESIPMGTYSQKYKFAATPVMWSNCKTGDKLIDFHPHF